MRDKTRAKWRNHKSSSLQRGLQHLTFDQYLKKLKDAGITIEQVGRRAGEYHLSRYEDKGDYTPESCRFVPAEINRAEARINGRIEVGRQKRLGRTKFNHESVARQASKMRGRTKETHEHLAIASAKAAETMRGRTKFTHAGHASQAEKTACNYAFIDPSGVLHTGRGLNDFARANGLHAPSMSKLRTGKLKSYHGWTLAKGALSEENSSAK